MGDWKRGAVLVAVLVAAPVATAMAGTPHVAFRFKIPAKVARSFSRDAHTEGNTYGYPVHGCAFTQAHRIYGCSVSAPGDWQLLTRLKPHVYTEYLVMHNQITKHFRYTP